MATMDSSDNRRVFGLDALRAVAIVLVLYQHGAMMFLTRAFPRVMHFLPADGVELFFVLSGFLIGTILLRHFDNADRFDFNVVRQFWARRWLRTLPAYLVILVVNIVFWTVVSKLLKGGELGTAPSRSTALFFVFSQNLAWLHPPFFVEAWSLAVEEWFYLVTPVLLATAVAIVRPATPNGKRRTFFSVIVAVLALSTLARLGQSWRMELMENTWDGYVRKIVLFRLDAIMFGVLGAYLKRYYPPVFAAGRAIKFVIGVLLVLLAQVVLKSYEDAILPLWLSAGHATVTAIGVLLLLPFADQSPVGPVGPLARRTMTCVTFLAAISYSLYLVNYNLIANPLAAVLTRVLRPGALASPVVAFGVLSVHVTLSIVAAYVLYRLVERPFMNRRQSEFRGEKNTPALTTV